MNLSHLSSAAAVVAVALSAAACSKSGSTQPDGGGSSTATSAAAPTGSGLLAGATLSMLTSGFEGEIDGFMQKAGEPQKPLAVLLKGDKLRFDVPEGMAPSAGPIAGGGKAYGILDTAAKKMTIVTEARRMAIVMDLNSGKPMPMGPPGASANGQPSGPPSKFVKTGKTETVAGYTCQDWDIVSDHKEGTLCVADRGVSWLSLPTTMFTGERAYLAELADGKHFPLRMVSYKKDGTTEESRIEVTKIDKKSVDDGQFQVPTGYTVMDMDKMFAGMRGMPGMPPGMGPGMMPPGMPPGAFSAMMQQHRQH